MFDGLKESISGFRSDVEEATDDVEEVAPPAEEADATDSETAADHDGAPADESTEADTPGLRGRAKSLATGKRVIDEEDLEGPLQDFELALLGADVAMEAAEAITDAVRERLVGEKRGLLEGTENVVDAAIRDALVEVLDVDDGDLVERIDGAEPPVVIVFTGINGVGKTTSIAKLSRYLADRGYDTVLANGDTYRAGAAEQIQEHADALDVPCIAHEQGGDPAAVLYDAVEYAEANDVDVVLADTAGRLHTSEDLMTQLSKIDRVVDPDLTVFVDEAVAGQDAVNRAREFDDAAAIDGAILTKADADASGGAAVSIAHVTGKPIFFLGTGQGYDDLRAFDPAGFAADLLGEE